MEKPHPYSRRAMIGEQQWQYEQSRAIHGPLGAFRPAFILPKQPEFGAQLPVAPPVSIE